MDQLLLGVAREDITPKVGGRLFGYNPNIFSTDIHDNLHLTAFAFSYGETKVLMINATICVICNPVSDELPQYVKVYYEQLIQSYEDGYVDKEVQEIPMTVVRIGDVIFAPFPFEMFSEIGFRIDGAFQDKKVITLSYTNGQMLYLPTEDQICRGGHEVNAFLYNPLQRFVNNADYHAVKSAVSIIETLPTE